jgi:O-antigen/teichoic acid export membrane protein
MPRNLIGNSISQVFFPSASEAHHAGTLGILVEKIFRVLLKLSVFPLLVLTFVADDMFVVFFGETWRLAGVISQFLSVWIIFWFISSPISTIITVHEKLKFGFKLSTLNLVTRFISLTIGGILGSPLLAIGLFSISGMLLYAISCFIILHFVGIPYARTLRHILQATAIFIPAGAVFLLMKYLGISSLVITGTAIIAVLLYYGYIIRTDITISQLWKQLGIVERFTSR